MTRSLSPVQQRTILGVLLAGLGLVLLRNAWMTEDAYITLRTVDNLVHGFGMRWNVAERVQSFTHPLWLLLITPFYALTREAYLTVSCLAWLAAMGTAAASLVRAWFPFRSAVVLLVLMMLSKAFVDFSVSGLENPLTHLLALVFVVVWFGDDDRPARLTGLALVAALCALSRLDTLLLLGPALLAAFWRRRAWRAVGDAAVGMLPLIAWTLFSLVYYGFPVANTAYAKLATGLPHRALAGQGWSYLLNTVRLDPVTPLVIVLGAIASIGRRRYLPLTAGIVLYLAYVVAIGGDFMSGRFLTAPFLLGAVLTARRTSGFRSRYWGATVAVLLVVGVLNPLGPVRSGAGYGGTITSSMDYTRNRGVADERAYYYRASGLLRYRRGGIWPDHAFARRGLAWREHPDTVLVAFNIGYAGYFAGPGPHLVDPLGLADPLLARLPIEAAAPWRVGHYQRRLPRGYLELLRGEAAGIEHPALATYEAALRLITRGPLLSRERLAAIVAMNLGRYDDLLREYAKHPVATGARDRRDDR